MIAFVAGAIQLVGTYFAGRNQTGRASMDALAYALLAAGPVALLVRRRFPVPVLLVVFGTTLAYWTTDYPRGPTRELGLFRAIGETRRQVRSMIRWESVIIAVFGTVGGLGVGVFLGWALVEAASQGTGDMIAPLFTAPVGQLAVLLVVGAAAGVLAGLRPARRAAKLPVLQAIVTE